MSTPRPVTLAEGRAQPSGRLIAGLLLLAGIAIAVALVWAGAVAAQRGWAPPTVSPSLVVARVHDEAVTWDQVAGRLRAANVMGQPAPSDLATWRETVSQTLESIVGEVLTRHAMEAQGFVVSEAMIDAQVRDLERRYGGGPALAAAMGQMQVTMAELRETQRRGLYLQALIDRIVPATDADIDAYLAQPGAAGLSRAEAAARIRAERAADVVPGFLGELRRDPGIWVINTEDLK